jgi:hypothetical protein
MMAFAGTLATADPRDPLFPKPNVFVDRVIGIRLQAWFVFAAREDAAFPI